jgi:hypothetical protein
MSKPVFIFSVGWLSGSIMLQHVITASSQKLIWGEAGDALDRLADTLACYGQMLGPGDQRFKHGFGGNGTEKYREFIAARSEGVHKWIVCMNPPLETFAALTPGLLLGTLLFVVVAAAHFSLGEIKSTAPFIYLSTMVIIGAVSYSAAFLLLPIQA